MTTPRSDANAYTLVVGLGVTGLSVVRHLHRLGESMVVIDSRDIPPALNEFKASFGDIPLYTGSFDSKLFVNAQRIVVSPGVPLSDPVLRQAREKGVEITGDIDLFAHEVEAPVVAITGSNGKSTVTTLLVQMANKAGLDAVAGGNIGLPVLDLLDGPKELYVLELSSFQLETLQRLPMQAAVVLNVSPDHMDRYADVNAYAMSKQAIYANASHAVVNRDDAYVSKMLNHQRNVVGFTMGKPDAGDFGLCETNGRQSLCLGDEVLIATEALKIRGQHNYANALAALALGASIDLPMQAMLDALKEFPGLAHRTQWVAEHDGINWFNDSKGTNVGATLAAIEGLPGRHVLIAGGQGKGADFSPLGEIAEKRLRAAVVIGEDAQAIAQVLDPVIPVRFAGAMKEAVVMAAELAQPGDNVLLSPACASFDMFKGFADRGECFIKAVEALA
ncbi:MAG: UDP-N-acetylmuramoyl-L-alanine--D-glutamate ligase [Thiotrichales bacterium]|nr:MAG: UDP-N-acetylmuramoyl-L-alanine--D-glutamate ligase [Thiotrichales bacterium]